MTCRLPAGRVCAAPLGRQRRARAVGWSRTQAQDLRPGGLIRLLRHAHVTSARHRRPAADLETRSLFVHCRWRTLRRPSLPRRYDVQGPNLVRRRRPSARPWRYARLGPEPAGRIVPRDNPNDQRRRVDLGRAHPRGRGSDHPPQPENPVRPCRSRRSSPT